MFFITVLSNLISAYLISSVARNFLVFYISLFGLIILNMEILSLFKSITDVNVFIFSILNLILSVLFFKYKKADFIKPKFDFEKFKNALLLDKSLIFLSFSFLILLAATLFLSLVVPVLEPDSQTYHFLRSYNFVKFQSLNHFETNDIRALIMPINSEILYSFLYLFKKNLYGYGIVTYVSFTTFIFSFFQIMSKFKFCLRKKLFAIFIFSSFASVICQIPSLQTDIIVGCLLSSAFCLFLEKTKILTYFASLSLAIAFGVKSTGVASVFAFYLIIFLYEKYVLKTKDHSKIKLFTEFLVLNFIIFSSYNYILNFLDFHNFLANKCALAGHGFWGGFKGYIANLINFCFQALDFTGFKWGYYLNYKILAFKNQVFNFLNINPYLGANFQMDKVNIITDEQTVGFGILGFFVFIPMLFKSTLQIFFNKNKRTIMLFIASLAFILNILILARMMAYMVYSIRFVITFVCLSAIILVNAYSKKGIYKTLTVWFCLFYLTLLPFCIKRMPFWWIFKDLKRNNFNIQLLQKDGFEDKIVSVWEGGYVLFNTINEKYKDIKKIGIVKTTQSSLLYLTTLENKDRKIDFLTAGKLTDEKLKKYDLIILEGEQQDDNVFNLEDIKIRYKMEGDNVIFVDDEDLNCVYKSKSSQTGGAELLERSCFTYFYLKNKKDFKLDYRENMYELENKFSKNKRTLYFYYFLKLY